MCKQLANKEENGFEWMDIPDADRQKVEEMAARLELPRELVEDCFVQDHLPKYESFGKLTFIILRTHNATTNKHDDTVPELTHKICIFYTADYILTIHKHSVDFLDDIQEHLQQTNCKSSYNLLNQIIRKCLLTYDKPAMQLLKTLSDNESRIFNRKKSKFILKELYFQKRRIDVLRRMLILSYDIIDNIDAEEGDINTRDTRDLYVKLKNIYDALAENTNQLMTIYFSISSQRTNEIMRVLTIFSVFFMPLTFIVGVYGMNFRFMPELQLRMGYPGVLILMSAITFCIYAWFKKKEWL